MKTNDMLAVIDRESTLLTADNWHASAAVMSQAAERIRDLAQRLREAGIEVDGPVSPLNAAISEFVRATGADRSEIIRIPDCDDPEGIPELFATVNGKAYTRLTSGQIVTKSR